MRRRDHDGQLTRRALLRGAIGVAGLWCWPTRASAIGPKTKVYLAQLGYRGGNPVPRSNALERLAWELDKRTSVEVGLDPVVIGPPYRELFSYPFLYMGGDRAFPQPSESFIEQLRRHLTYGGTLLLDSAEARPGGGFDRSVRALIERIFPDEPLQRFDRKHTLYKSFYLLDKAVGRVDLVPYLEGVQRDGRALLVYTQNDLAGAWARDNFGQWEYNVYPGGDRQRELAFRWGINIVMYALCVDYKADQVHVPFILRRRQWRVE